MATFQYNALTGAGRLMKGTIEAGSPAEAAETLKQMELNVSLLEKAKPEQLRTPVGRNEFLLFNQQLASITKAGVPLERGLRELSRDVASPAMRRLIDECRGRPGGGHAHRGSVRETGEAVSAALRADSEGGGRDGPAQRDAHEPQPPPGTGRTHAPHRLRGDQLSRRDPGSRRDHHHRRLSVRGSPVQAGPARDGRRQAQSPHDRRARPCRTISSRSGSPSAF